MFLILGNNYEIYHEIEICSRSYAASPLPPSPTPTRCSQFGLHQSVVKEFADIKERISYINPHRWSPDATFES